MTAKNDKQKEKEKKEPRPDTQAVIQRDEVKLERFESFLTTDFMPLVERAWLKDFPFDAGRFVQITLGLMQRTPTVLYCEPLSLIGALLQCAEYALYPDAIRGHCWIIPRWDWKISMDRANFQIGYKGAIVLFRRSGMAAEHAVDASDVYDNEGFDLEKGLNPILRHVPWYALKPKPAEAPGNLKGTYAICHYSGGQSHFEFVPKSILDEIRDHYAGKPGDKSKPPGPDTPWFQSEVSASWMRKKSALIQTLKLSPALDDAALSKAVAQDEILDQGLDQGLQHMLSGQQKALAQKLLEAADTRVAVSVPSTNEVRKGALDALMERRDKEKGEPTKAQPAASDKGKQAPPKGKQGSDEPPPVGELAEPPKEAKEPPKKETAKAPPKEAPPKEAPPAEAPTKEDPPAKEEPPEDDTTWDDFMKGQ